jgi:hypothetical protein
VIEASCHCGQVRIELPEPPTSLTSCNCSLCRRYGGLWAYYPADQVKVTVGEGKTVAYVQGDRTLESHHCPTCGCVTHWRGLGEHAHRSAVNMRLAPPDLLDGLTIRHLDGADTWTVLGESTFRHHGFHLSTDNLSNRP